VARSADSTPESAPRSKPVVVLVMSGPPVGGVNTCQLIKIEDVADPAMTLQ
jgi:hypothetical protein